MATFDEARRALWAAREERSAAAEAVTRNRERLKLLAREEERVLRSAGRDSEAFQALAGRREQAERVLAGERRRLEALVAEEGLRLREFEPFSDPTREISRLSDDDPILLFPLRLETRFKRLQEDGVTRHQLWVRVFPDDCSIDTFDPTLSEAELAKAQNFWTHRWKTGSAGTEELEASVRDAERGTWRELMGTFNAGRAYWIERNYRPLNEGEMPTRSSEDETILVIPTEEPPDPATRAALVDFWRAAFLAAGDATATAVAMTALATALGVGEEEARALTELYRPDDFEPAAPFAPSEPPPVQGVFLVFPPNAEQPIRSAAWSGAARVTTLPDRLVLLGFLADRGEPVLQQLGAPIRRPLIVGPDPSLDVAEVLRAVHGEAFDDLSDDEKAERYVEYLAGQSETKWLFDFDEAVRVGMGFKVDLTAALHASGFDRLFVLGVRLSDGEEGGRAALEELLAHHHFGDSGLSILPQGTPTNNTEESRSGYADNDDPDEAFDHYHPAEAPDDPSDPAGKRDGRWLAELLGVGTGHDASSLALVPGYHLTDQREARAMNTALWNATLGYTMESMLTPVFSEWQRHLTRWFLIHHVSGRGRLPVLRIGDQPYGIQPATTFTDMRWLEQEDDSLPRTLRRYRRGLHGIYTVLQTIREDWEERLDEVAYVGKRGGVDAHEILLQALGLHSGSVEFDQRYAESFEHQYNWLIAHGLDDLVELLARLYRQRGMELLERLGYVHDLKLDPAVPILDRFFLTAEHDVVKPLIDDRDLSEVDPIRPYTDAPDNYIGWLIENARNNHRNIREHKGFSDGKPPYALLYDLLRHALNLEFAGTALNLYRAAEILDEAQADVLRMDAEFIGVQAQPGKLESKWDLIYRADPRITDGSTLLVDHITELVRSRVVDSRTRNLQEMIEALELLRDAPTARLERAFAEHLDLCTYRLDAWLLGLVDAQLHEMRYRRNGGRDAGFERDDGNVAGARRGIHLGAFGWLENLRPDRRTLEPAPLSPEQREVFDPDGSLEPMLDDRNAGYVHAPSIPHALTAAVLRNAYISNASEEAAEPYKVNLSSERVRAALAIIEGMQQGQSLGELLGYRLERGLHDNTTIELDIYIYELRKVFSLGSNQLRPTQIRRGRPAETTADEERNQEEEEALSGSGAVTKIEARNVVDGLRLLDHIRETGKESYPFGLEIGDGPDRLRAAPKPERAAIDREVRRLMDDRDAFADLAMAESVHQVVQGNYERAAGALDTYSKGNYPQLPDVVRSPGSGAHLTHRVGIHLPAGATALATDTPRAKAEPAIDRWIADLLPADRSTIACRVQYTVPNYDDSLPDDVITKTVTMTALGLQPIDLLYAVAVETDKGLTALDDRVLAVVHADDPRADVEVSILYTHVFDPADGILSFFELMPLVDGLRTLITSSRPLLPADLAPPIEGRRSQNAGAVIDTARLRNAHQGVVDRLDALQLALVDALAPLIDDDDFEVTLANQAALVAQAEARLDDFVTHLSALGLYGIPQAGFGFVYERRRAIHRAVCVKVAEFRDRWRERQNRYTTLLGTELPDAGSDEERYAILDEAERQVSTTVSVPPPPIPNYLTELAVKKLAFDTKLAGFDTFLATKFASLDALLTAAEVLKTDLPKFDPTPLTFDDEVRQVVVLVEDLYEQVREMIATLRQKMAQADQLLDDAEASTDAEERLSLTADAAHGIFGDQFLLVPRFTFAAEQAVELAQCFTDRAQLLDHQMSVVGTDFPVDDWLYGVARVREKMAAWESVVMLAEGYRERPPLDLTPLQLPYVEDDHWLGLTYPEDHQISGDKLLYTAYLPAFDPTVPQAGLLVDEWTEVVPARKETTGLTFHYDRPNSEPPQSLLLVTPPAFTGAWHWGDVVRTLHETLDLARLRAIEPDHVDRTPYARFLPATVAVTTARPVTMALNFALAAEQLATIRGDDDA